MSPVRIFGLATLIRTLITTCNVINKFSGTIRVFVPDESKAAYDAALTAIMGGCDVIRAIDYLDASSKTNPIWGA